MEKYFLSCAPPICVHPAEEGFANPGFNYSSVGSVLTSVHSVSDCVLSVHSPESVGHSQVSQRSFSSGFRVIRAFRGKSSEAATGLFATPSSFGLRPDRLPRQFFQRPPACFALQLRLDEGKNIWRYPPDRRARFYEEYPHLSRLTARAGRARRKDTTSVRSAFLFPIYPRAG